MDGKLLGRACDCQVISQLVCFQISPALAKCGRGYDKRRSGLRPGAKLMIKCFRVPSSLSFTLRCAKKNAI